MCLSKLENEREFLRRRESICDREMEKKREGLRMKERERERERDGCVSKTPASSIKGEQNVFFDLKLKHST